MSLANKFGISQSLLDVVQASLNESTAYQAKVKAHMAKKGVKSLDDMSAEQKKSFFNELDAMHKAKNEEVEPVEEAESAQSKTTMKHISKPTAGEKKAAKDIKPGISGYRDRVAMLKSAEARGALKNEEVESVEEAESAQSKTTMKHISNPTAGEKKAAKDIKPGISGYRDRVAMLKSAAARGGLKEEDQIDELSKKTLGSYVKKSSTDAVNSASSHTAYGAAAKKAGLDGDKKKEDNLKKSSDLYAKQTAKRQAGVGKAVERLMTKEEVELSQEDLDFIASLNDSDIELDETVRTPGHIKKDLEDKYGPSQTTITGTNTTQHVIRHLNDDGEDAYEVRTHELIGRGKDSKVGKLIKHTKPSKKFFKEDFDLEDFTIEEIEEAIGKRPTRADRFHIVAKDGKPSSLASYGDKGSAMKDRDEKHPGAQVHQVGPRGTVKKVYEEIDLEDFTVEEIEEFMQTEDFDQLDELSKTTLGSYIKKRSHDVAAQGAITRHHAERSEREKKDPNLGNQRRSAAQADKAFAKGWKHRVNIGKAVDRLTKD